MIFTLKYRPDRIGTEILSLLFQFYYCFVNKYYVYYNKNIVKYSDSIFIKCILIIIDEYNNSINKSLICAPDNINIPGPGETDMCYGMGKMVQIIKSDFLSFFKENFYKNIVNYYQENTQYNIPFDVENSIVIHLRLDDQWWESDYDGSVCSNHYIEKINNGKDCLFTNGPNNKYNKQNPLSTEKIKKQLQILLTEFPNNKIIIISSPLTEIHPLSFKYDMLIQSSDYNYDLYLLSRAKKIILSRSNFALISLFFGEQTHVHMPLWGHFACAGFGTKYDKCRFNYFY